jgi:hypothetical protein
VRFIKKGKVKLPDLTDAASRKFRHSTLRDFDPPAVLAEPSGHCPCPLWVWNGLFASARDKSGFCFQRYYIA